jgi:hypothetical protein
MLLYIAATNQVVSSTLVVERVEDGKEHEVQRPVYYLSEVLSPTKQRYPHYQKLAYAIYMTGKKLPHYFECHSIIVVASTPVSSILNNPDVIGHVLLSGITLGPWEITYQRQSSIKSQVLLDFIAEWTEAQMTVLPDLSNSWTIYFDGSKRVSGAGAGVVLVSPQGDKMHYVLRMRFANPSNNKAECRGDDLGGAPRAGQYAGWRPRSPHGFNTRRPAPPEGPAAPAAGWRLHRGELEPGDEDKASQRLSGQK